VARTNFVCPCLISCWNFNVYLPVSKQNLGTAANFNAAVCRAASLPLYIEKVTEGLI
jgi:hypothetical protein